MSSFDIDHTARLAEKSLAGLWAKQQTITDNIANVSTPGYKSRRLSFDAYLENALADDANPADFVRRSGATSMRADGNNVDLERELVALSENSLRYRSVMGQLQRKLDTLAAVVRE